MSDYISKSALVDALAEQAKNMAEVAANAAGQAVDYYSGMKTGFASAAIVANSAPTIDAVPVVRCKDCRWKEEEQPGMVYCPATVGGWVDEDWFCKGGERSEDEGTDEHI